MHLLRSSLLFSVVFVLGCRQEYRPQPPAAPADRYSPAAHSAQRPPRARPTTASGFDFYLLNLSWSPAYCASHTDAPECSRHLGLVLHGLWPQNTDGTYPEHCSNAPGPSNPAQYSDLFPDTGLLQHEWSTHGTCSGLAPDAYFSLARKAFHAVQPPATLGTGTQAATLTPAQLLQQVVQQNPSIPAQSLALTCGNNTFTALEVCFDKALQPTSCSSVRSCGARTITVRPRS